MSFTVQEHTAIAGNIRDICNKMSGVQVLLMRNGNKDSRLAGAAARSALSVQKLRADLNNQYIRDGHQGATPYYGDDTPQREKADGEEGGQSG